MADEINSEMTFGGYVDDKSIFDSDNQMKELAKFIASSLGETDEEIVIAPIPES